MSDQTWLSKLKQHKAIAVIRSPKMYWGEQMAMAVASTGMQLIEITWDSDRARDLISKLRVHLPHCLIGTGTLFNVQQLQEAIAAGAQFLFTPHTDVEMIKMAVFKNVPIIPGALTPTEIITAWHQGASSVKVFPVQAMGGVNYIRSLQGPLGHIPLIPTGGVTIDNASAFLQGGAIAVGLSGELFPKQWVITENWSAISKQSKDLMVRLNGS
ncbi:bifunctional 4-hydroxy-2-oxoglutarate aldolase/2-dehydro-3-deoxy-phosphogluconate aldolase [Cylindrospermopsis raciborskii CS-506_D]|uniref:Bifunctional 4-hydroxy-2-oxoglutarate aldolase/2-dehydro-3-deoxy-phosphogluconate aldolase n=1 Tax=Cylindrospermopsis raciborskii CS-506_A TaxID=2585140 RepID=A0A838WVS7_9CYAN|nr:bifunctional 4-hydroxy-2-oxoglutarate aldolase/2-dehydro-3-deoxy-phosphogluconate aldolase [Cylindrospermopsis raciborskii]MBA4446028.1 bifunctional 4-hydroxy-2-oxoglutarate aldolase/2-dehydro-3-deoxy-phosphogluconate aldolase [Cylindrospermopsis raciborskii CS-506_C]MBA4450258.1 bifunctional 4-hydroxy-2-oxoglutarate aldolase/2-dehydro-3-deoxy-phosphogluconate aldolase [Cylindrospermopsis raciborskii CS-506_D]MBA4456882.1 bifunctional 4-hydroxy-2-oxoglutarate aldolase/2-dehydro-3-deoxy-phosph